MDRRLTCADIAGIVSRPISDIPPAPRGRGARGHRLGFGPMPVNDTPGPLDGYLVIDLTRALAGPHAGMMLADLGARVIKVETPGTGDDTRGWGPPFMGPDDDRVSTYYLSCNRDKESVTADLKSDDGRALLEGLIERADVLVENFRPGVLDRLGFGADRMRDLNPRLVVLSITGFGHDGPEAGRAGYDQIAQGEAGLIWETRPPRGPTPGGRPRRGWLAGGDVVRTSLLSAIVGVHAFQGTRWTVAHEVPQGPGNHHPSIAPYGLFHAADGALQIAVGSESQWRGFSPPVGRDPGGVRV